MSNESQLPRSSKQGISNSNPIGNALGKLAEGLQQKQNGEKAQEDLNVLPFPISQSIRNGWVEWEWPLFGVNKILGVLYTNDGNDDHAKGEYVVQVFFENDEVTKEYDPERAKVFGHAMLSASNWINVWKDHAGIFLEKEFMGE